MSDKLIVHAYNVDGDLEELTLEGQIGANSAGAEGTVYKTNHPGIVAKVYHLSKDPDKNKATENKYNKIRALLEMELRYPGVCFPVQMLTSKNGEFIGYTMEEARGDTVSDVIHPMVIKDEFPNLKRLDLVNICISILEQIEYVHKQGVLLCDINRKNILIDGLETGNIKTYLIDIDSCQVGDLLGEVGIPEFVPPELQGKKLDTVKRTKQQEYFAVATLLFMIMLPGRTPYARIGGEGDVAKNVKAGVFPYAKGGDYSGQDAPNLMYRRIWSHLAFKNYFWETFHKDGKHNAPESRIPVSDWLRYFRKYRELLTDGTIENEDPEGLEVFPKDFKRQAAICPICEEKFFRDFEGQETCPTCSELTLVCERCNEEFTYSFKEQKYDFAVGNKKPTLCRKCRNTVICGTCGRKIPYSAEDRERDRRAGRKPPTECDICKDTKPCPVCGKTRVPKNFTYCKNCKDKVAEYRECVNCHEKFPVTYGQLRWESKKAEEFYKGYSSARKPPKKRQCKTCSDAHCTEDPCIHSKSRQAEMRSKQQAQQAQSTQKSGGGCYIATAVYGSYSHPQTMVLRAYRDNVLQKNPGGRAFIRVYYALSPKIVSLFGDSAWFNRFWRKRLDAMVEHIKSKYGY